jgi:hypothetical protein
MGVEFEIEFGLATLKVNLSEFVAVAEQIAGITKHKEAREALRDAISNIRKSSDTAVDVFTPLYALADEADFAKSFPTLHASFKNAYLKSAGEVRTSCTIAKQHLEALLKKKEWLVNMPLLERSYTRLETLCYRWFFSDIALSGQMESFLQNIDDFYTDISQIAQTDISAAFSALRSCLLQYQDEILSLRKQLNALDLLSRTL